MFSNRIINILLEEAISKEIEVDKNIEHFSPTGINYDHYKLKFNDNQFSCVSIIRAGDSMLDPLLKLLPRISVGKILIQRDEETAQPKFVYEKLPKDIKNS